MIAVACMPPLFVRTGARATVDPGLMLPEISTPVSEMVVSREILPVFEYNLDCLI